MGLVRWLYESGGFSPISILVSDLRYAIPNYPDSDYRLPEAEGEAKFLEENFNATKIEPTSSEVRSALSGTKTSLLHFAGHGVTEQDNIGNSKLLLQGKLTDKGAYVPDYLSATTVSQFGRFSKFPLVVLNACQVGQ